jgi:hypothetical protein
MRYLLLLTGEDPGTEVEPDPSVCADWTAEMTRRGVLRQAEGLRPVAESTTVRVRGDEVLLTDGPFAETKDQIGGLNIVECADLDEAIEVAASHPAAALGAVEIRPIMDPMPDR